MFTALFFFFLPAKPVLDVNRIYWKLKLPHRRESQTPHLEAKMILTNCAACAAPLAHDSPRCVRCQTRYCSKLCLRKNAHRGGHTPPPQDAPRPRGGIRAPSPAFKVGDKVDARFRGWSTFYSGTIHKVHCAALYDVTYDAGYTETNVSSKFIRRRR